MRLTPLLPLACLLLAPQALAIELFDRALDPINWEAATFTRMPGSAAGMWVRSGGNPGTFRRIDLDVGRASADPGDAAVMWIEIRKGAEFSVDPRAIGGIRAVGYREDYQCLSEEGCFKEGQTQGPALRQGASYYVTIVQNSRVTKGWVTLDRQNLQESDFSLVTNLQSGLLDTSEHPDFSDGAANPIQFGFFRRFTTTVRRFSFPADLDNWSVSIQAGPASDSGGSAEKRVLGIQPVRTTSNIGNES